MSFKFQWPSFSEEFYASVRAELTNALNSGERHPSLADDIVASDVFFGTIPPRLEILEVSDMTEERFKAVIKVQYDGDGTITLTTKAQANPVKPTTGRQPTRGGRMRPGILAAHKPLIVPIWVRISQLRLDAIGVIDMHKQRGVSLSFKNDPLKSVKISTSFDDNAAIARMLQNSLEGELRELFNTGIPDLVHKLSQQHIDEQRKAKTAKAAAKRPPRMSRSMPASPDFRRSASLQTRTKPPCPSRFSRLESVPSDAEAARLAVGAQLSNLAHSQSTISPFTTAYQPDHVINRTNPLASGSMHELSTTAGPASTPDLLPRANETKTAAAHLRAGDLRDSASTGYLKEGALSPHPMLASSLKGFIGHARQGSSSTPVSPQPERKAEATNRHELAAGPSATLTASDAEGGTRRFEFEIPTFNASVAAQFLARRSSSKILADQLLGPPSTSSLRGRTVAKGGAMGMGILHEASSGETARTLPSSSVGLSKAGDSDETRSLSIIRMQSYDPPASSTKGPLSDAERMANLRRMSID